MIEYDLKKNNNKKNEKAYGKYYAKPHISETVDLDELADHMHRCPLRCAAKILCKLCFVGFHRMTKTSKLAIHGSISPCLGVHASAFLCFTA